VIFRIFRVDGQNVLRHVPVNDNATPKRKQRKMTIRTLPARDPRTGRFIKSAITPYAPRCVVTGRFLSDAAVVEMFENSVPDIQPVRAIVPNTSHKLPTLPRVGIFERAAIRCADFLERTVFSPNGIAAFGVIAVFAS
jgi:hypothetical protein